MRTPALSGWRILQVGKMRREAKREVIQSAGDVFAIYFVNGVLGCGKL
jgi:hypothetical protein